MDNQSYSNLIEAYLNHQLSETERLNFELLCRQDPILNSEFKLQQDIVQAIQEYRKSELKQRLALIPTEGLVSTYSYWKSTLVALGLSGVLFTSGIFIYQSANKKATVLNATSKDLSQLLAELPQPIQEEVISEENLQQLNSIESMVEENSKVIQPSIDLEATKQKVSSAFESLNPQENLSKINDALFDKTPESTDKTDTNSNIEESIYPSAEPEIQYQYYNEKLFLHQNKSRGSLIPYENQYGITRYYLLYEGYFYEINNNQEEIATPKVVKDIEIIRELKRLQEIYTR